MLFHIIAEHEMNIEEVRMELCQNSEFSPKALFKFLKMEKKDGDAISCEQIREFIYRDNEMKDDCLDLVVKEIIRDFDCDLDGALNYQEFVNVFLPATSEQVRKECMARKGTSEPDSLILLLASKILRYEKSLAFQKIYFRNKLLENEAFKEKQAFDKICAFSRDATRIDMVALKCFLQSLSLPNLSTLTILEKVKKCHQNFDHRTADLDMAYKGPVSKVTIKDEHLDAIRRRCDHDGDEMISFGEF